MSERFPVTVIPVLGGVVAGITVTRRSVLPPGTTAVGLALIAANSVVPPLPQVFGVVDALRGADGTVEAKSFILLSVSWQPPSRRDWLLLTAGAEVTVVSTNAFVAVPQPTESITAPVFGAPCLIASPPPASAIAHWQVVLL